MRATMNGQPKWMAIAPTAERPQWLGNVRDPHGGKPASPPALPRTVPQRPQIGSEGEVGICTCCGYPVPLGSRQHCEGSRSGDQGVGIGASVDRPNRPSSGSGHQQNRSSGNQQDRLRPPAEWGVISPVLYWVRKLKLNRGARINFYLFMVALGWAGFELFK